MSEVSDPRLGDLADTYEPGNSDQASSGEREKVEVDPKVLEALVRGFEDLDQRLKAVEESSGTQEQGTDEESELTDLKQDFLDRGDGNLRYGATLYVRDVLNREIKDLTGRSGWTQSNGRLLSDSDILAIVANAEVLLDNTPEQRTSPENDKVSRVRLTTNGILEKWDSEQGSFVPIEMNQEDLENSVETRKTELLEQKAEIQETLANLDDDAPEKAILIARLVGINAELASFEAASQEEARSTAPSIDALPGRESDQNSKGFAKESRLQRIWRKMNVGLNTAQLRASEYLADAKAYRDAKASAKEFRVNGYTAAARMQYPDASESDIRWFARKREKQYNRDIDNVGLQRFNNWRKEAFRKIDRDQYASDEQYDEARRDRRNVLLGGAALGLPVAAAAGIVAARIAPGAAEWIGGLFDSNASGGGVGGGLGSAIPEAINDNREYGEGVLDPGNLEANQNDNELVTDPYPGEYTAENIEVDYSEYLSSNKKSPNSIGTAMDMTSLETAMNDMYDRAEGGPDHSAQMAISALSDDKMEEFGLDGLTPQEIDQKLTDNGARAEVLNTIQAEIESGNVKLEIVDNVSGTFYNWGAEPVYDSNGELVDTRLIQVEQQLDNVTVLRVINADGDISYFNSECKNYMTEVPSQNVPVVAAPSEVSTDTPTGSGGGSEGPGDSGNPEGPGDGGNPGEPGGGGGNEPEDKPKNKAKDSTENVLYDREESDGNAGDRYTSDKADATETSATDAINSGDAGGSEISTSQAEADAQAERDRQAAALQAEEKARQEAEQAAAQRAEQEARDEAARAAQAAADEQQRQEAIAAEQARLAEEQRLRDEAAAAQAEAERVAAAGEAGDTQGEDPVQTGTVEE